MKKVEILKKNVNIANRNKSKENNYFYMFLCTYYSIHLQCVQQSQILKILNPLLDTTRRARFEFCGKAESYCFPRHSNRCFRMEVTLNSGLAGEIPSKIFIANAIANIPLVEESFCF